MYSPDEREKIEAEMQADAMPSPKEIAEEGRRFLAENGCRDCDEDDPDNLGAHHPIDNFCGKQVMPDPVVLCEDCAEARPSREEQAVQNARDNDDDVVVIYSCGHWTTVSEEVPTVEVDKQTGWTDDGDPIMETVEQEHPHATPEVTFETQCQCGAGVKDIRFL